MGREAVGGGHHNPFQVLICFVRVVPPKLLHGSVVRCQSTSSHGARRRLIFVQPFFRPAK